MTELTAIADLTNIVSRWKSQHERDWDNFGYLFIQEMFDEPLSVTLYEPITFKLPGGSYTPDFLHITASGRMVFVEIKGSKQQKGYRDARAKLRAAAELHPWFAFIEARGISNNWEVERIKA